MRIMIIIISALILTPSFITNGSSENTNILQIHQDDPTYAKWGRLAMEETKSRYPDASIIDYLHRGRTDEGEYTVEKFKLWLEEDKKQFGVFIDITFDSETDKVHDISFTETNQ